MMIDFRDVGEYTRYKARQTRTSAKTMFKAALTNTMIWAGLAGMAVMIVEWHHMVNYFGRD